ncbi:MAG: hypothetical protein KDJ52_32290 [Anaerolineae bacterium]|nr:hypothetical protein [Anaerolineae bacterium]
MTQSPKPWVVAQYLATALFSLKPASSTSSGGKSLLVPTPFALKMALLDAAIRTEGQQVGKARFKTIRDLQIAIYLPEKAVVNNTFIKILRPHKAGPKDVNGTGLLTPMGNTIAFREYVNFGEAMSLAFQGMPTAQLAPLLLQINYLGKRGGFMQLQGEPTAYDWSTNDLRTNGYTLLTEPMTEFSVNGLLQMLDDCGPKMTFDHANIYSGKAIKLGRERILRHIVLPYRLVRSSKGYSYYERIDA